MIFVTGCTHFFHKLMVVQRGFKDLEDMNDRMVERWNEVVGKKDIVYHLGDFALAKATDIVQIAERLNGRIRWIRGNHDNRKTVKKVMTLTNKFEWFKDVEGVELPINISGVTENKYVWMSHFAHRVWGKRHYGSIHLHSHSHCTLPAYKNSLDVGIDGWDAPLHLEGIVRSINFINESLERHKECLSKGEYYINYCGNLVKRHELSGRDND